MVGIVAKCLEEINMEINGGSMTAAKSTDDEGSTEYGRAVRQVGQEKRANNRDSSAQYLRERDIPFTSHNNGAHLIVEGKTCYIDFWPGTGKWHCRSGKKGFGVRNLVAYCQTGAFSLEPPP